MDYEELERLGTTQLGLVTRRQGERSFGSGIFDRLIRTKQLVPVFRSVYRVAGSLETRQQRIMAAVLASPTEAVASHLSALELLGRPLRNYHADDVHVSVAHHAAHRIPGIRTHRARHLPKHHLTEVDGIPCTNMARTIADLVSQDIDTTSIARLMDDSVVDGDCSYQEILRVITDCGSRGRSGTTRLRELLDERIDINIDQKRISKLQLRFLKLVAREGLPQPESEYRIWKDKHHWYDLDAAWPDLKIGVEMDGFNAHAKSKKRFDHDKERDNYLWSEGWEMLHFTARMSDANILSYVRKAVTKT